MAISQIMLLLVMMLYGCDNHLAQLKEEPSAEPEFDSILVIYQGETDSNELNELVIQSAGTFTEAPRIEKSSLEMIDTTCDSSKKMACIHIKYPKRNNGFVARITGNPKRVSATFGRISTWANDCGQHFVYAYFREQTRLDLMTQSELGDKIKQIELDSLSSKLYEAYIDSTMKYYKNKPFYCM